MRTFTALALALIAAPAVPAAAEEAVYAGQDLRAIKSLSAAEIDGLRAGAGLGYAKSAELNGWPGPLHVLELADRLDLAEDQSTRIETIRETMLARARPLGDALIKAEAALDALFAEGTPDEAAILEATAAIGAIEARLRAVHLAAHVETAPLLSRHQRMLYARERGYAAGHDGHHAH